MKYKGFVITYNEEYNEWHVGINHPDVPEVFIEPTEEEAKALVDYFESCIGGRE